MEVVDKAFPQRSESDSMYNKTGTMDSSKMSDDKISSVDVTGTPTAFVMESLKPKNDVVIRHKTKVSQVRVKPPGRATYEWQWDIIKFDKAFPLPVYGHYPGKNKVLKSEKIVAGADIGRKSDWHFVLSESNGKLNWYVVLAKIHKGGGNWINTAFTLSIVDAQENEILQRIRCFRDFTENFQFGWNDIVELEQIYENRDSYLAENTLRFRVLFEIFADNSRKLAESMKQEKNDFAKLVTNDLHRLRISTGTADVHLDCEGKIFPVHKLILSARSDVFAKMFNTPVGQTTACTTDSKFSCNAIAGGDSPPEGEDKVSRVAILDMEPEIMEIALDYIYSGKVPALNSTQTLCDVVRAADKFQLLGLKSHCFNALMNFVNAENIGQLAVLTYRHQADRSVRMNINGFCLRNLAELMRSKSFRDAMKAEPDAFFPDEEN